MQVLLIKATVTAGWVSSVVSVGIIGHFTSVPAWTVLTGIAVVPPLIVLWRLRIPPRTLSERIQEALR